MSTYADPTLRKLVAPDNDAKELADVLRDRTIGKFEVTQVRNRRKAALERTIEGFFAGRAVDDTLLLYFSGHGVKDDYGRLYLAAQDTKRGLLRSTAISDAFLKDVMGTSRARSQILILDCCFGGAFAASLLHKGHADTVEVNERFQGEGRVILTASTAMEFAFEEDRQEDQTPILSVFTRTVVEGLRTGKADDDNDNLISVQDLYTYAHKRIALPGSRQTPTISTIGQEGSIYVAWVPEAARTSRAISTQLLSGTGPAEELDFRPWARIRDQGTESSNLAVAAVMALETRLALSGSDVRLSPRYVTQKSKQLSKRKPGDDTGLEMPVVASVLEDFGVPPESHWPYVAGKWELPRGTTWRDLDRRASEYRARLIPVSSLDEIAFNLRKGRPILATFAVYKSAWYSDTTAREGIVPAIDPAGEPMLGAMATTIVGMNEATRTLMFAHTWGESWGLRGFGEMSVDAAIALLVEQEMWAVDVRTDSRFSWTATAFTPKPSRPTRRATRGGASSTDAVRGSADAAAYVGTARRIVHDARHRLVRWEATGEPDGPPARSEGDSPSGDFAIDTTFDAMGSFREFVERVFERDSWDGKGGTLEAVVRYGREYENAHWNGRRVVLGDGGAFMGDLYRLDVIAKELSMGLLEHDSSWDYMGESGALVQSIGLVFASMVKQYVAGQPVTDADWLIGDGLLRHGDALTSLEHPGTAYDDPTIGKDPQVGHMSDYVVTEVDSGGVHVNCGIPNRGFVLFAKQLGGHSWDRAGKVWYRAIHDDKLGTKPTFADYAAATVRATRSLYPRDPKVVAALTEAWTAVGVNPSGSSTARSTRRPRR